MEPKLLALLEKSYLFSTAHCDFNASVKIIPMEKFRFFLPNCFMFGKEEDQMANFGRILLWFIKKYLKAWLPLMESDPKNPFNWEKYNSDSIDFFLSFKKKELFDRVVPGDETVSIPIPLNNSQLLIQRMGDILVFNVAHISSEDKEHITGLKAIEMICREPDRSNNQGVYELVQSVQLHFPLPKERTENGGTEGDVDFQSIDAMLKRVLPQIEWSFDPKFIVDLYKDVDRSGAIIGKYFNLSIRARLIHDEKGKKENIVNEEFSHKPRACTFRIGNASKISQWKYRFREADGMSLIFSLESSLPYSLWRKDIDNSFRACREQFIIANAGAILSTRICSEMLHLYQTHSVGLGN